MSPPLGTRNKIGIKRVYSDMEQKDEDSGLLEVPRVTGLVDRIISDAVQRAVALRVKEVPRLTPLEKAFLQELVVEKSVRSVVDHWTYGRTGQCVIKEISETIGVQNVMTYLRDVLQWDESEQKQKVIAGIEHAVEKAIPGSSGAAFTTLIKFCLNADNYTIRKKPSSTELNGIVKILDTGDAFGLDKTKLQLLRYFLSNSEEIGRPV